MNKLRVSVAALALSFAGFVGIATQEGYVERATVPTKNDRPTHGFGSTFNADGSPVKLGESTTPVRALITAQAHISKEEQKFRDSLPGVKLYQGEYDIYMDWVYQFGTGAWSRSSMRRNLLAGDYVAACNALLLYKYSGGYDCSIPGNKRCAGVWTRQQERNRKCLALQN
jgi:GH24 family phage-related lysozyme (muramidase)